MRLPFILATLTGLPACSVAAHSTTTDTDDAIQHQISRVESSLPVVAKDGRRLEYSLQEWMKELGIPGVSIAVIDDYQVVWARGYGVTNGETTAAPVTSRTLFQAASISKPVTALALLHFTEQGAFDLDTDVNEYLQSWNLPEADTPGTDKATLRHLLAHTAGITPGGFSGYERNAPLPDITQILDGEPPANNAAARVVSTPGSVVSYSGLGYTMVQLALTDRVGNAFQEIVRESVFHPVGMFDSTFEQVLPDALAARAAHGHRSTGAAIPGGWYVFPELAAAGLWTTPSDLALLAIDVAKSKSRQASSGQIVSHKMARQMLSQQKDEMGLGFVIRPGDTHGYFAHSGGNQGYRGHFEMLADTGQGVVVLTNSDAGHLLISLLLRSVAQAYEWPSQPRPVSAALTEAIFTQLEHAKTTRSKVEVDERTLARYVGQYELSPGLEFKVTLVDGDLAVKLGDQPRFPVYPESESTFFFEVVDAQITFVRNESGEVVSLVLHQGGRDQEAKRIR